VGCGRVREVAPCQGCSCRCSQKKEKDLFHFLFVSAVCVCSITLLHHNALLFVAGLVCWMLRVVAHCNRLWRCYHCFTRPSSTHSRPVRTAVVSGVSCQTVAPAVRGSARQYAAQCSAMQGGGLRCIAVQCDAVRRSAVQCSTVVRCGGARQRAAECGAVRKCERTLVCSQCYLASVWYRSESSNYFCCFIA
jgi:hypothetical protein